MSAKNRKKSIAPLICIIPIALAAACAAFSLKKYDALYVAPKEETFTTDVAASCSNGAGRGFSGLELFSSNAILFPFFFAISSPSFLCIYTVDFLLGERRQFLSAHF